MCCIWQDLMEKSQRADFLFEADHDHEEAALPGRHAEEDNNASMLCFGSCGPMTPSRDSSRRRQPTEAKPPRTSSLASVTKQGR
jgi:hypothetical protein